MAMRDYENLKDITIPPEQEAIMNLIMEAWEECHESNCKYCPDRLKKFMSIVECHSLKFSRKLMEAGYAPVVRCKDCRFCKKHPTSDKTKMCTNEQQWVVECYPLVFDNDYCSYGERKEE